MTDLGTYIEHEGRPAVRFERTYAHPIDRVWAAVTEPEQLRTWFPSSVTLEPRVGGTISFSDDPHLTDQRGTVLTFEPPTRLAFTWGGDELHFELEAIDDRRCRFTLINVLEARDAAARNASGWTVCLGELDLELAGLPHDGPHSDSVPPFRPIYESYVAAGLPSGAPIPD